MLDTTTTHPHDGSDSAVSSVDVRELDDHSVLSFVVDQRRAADRAEANLLAGVVHWVDLHPVVAGPGPGSSGPGSGWSEAASWPVDRPLGWLPPDGSTCPLAGVGTPQVTEAAVVDLAAALGVPYRAGCQLVSDALELHHRLPRLWTLMQTGVLVAWKARRAAAQTTGLSMPAAAFVDRHLAVTARNGDLPAHLVKPLVHEALLQHDPDVAAGIEDAALTKRGVWFDHRDSTATTQVTGVLDTLDAIDLDHALSQTAVQMKTLGDTDSLDVRRAHALGLLASPQRVLELFDGPNGSDAREAPVAIDSVDAPATAEHSGPFTRTGATVYVHLALADLAVGSGGGRVEKLGAASLDLLEQWLTRLGLAGTGVKIRTVLDMNRDDAVDVHDPPDWMRELVILRDRHCVFPGCRTDARSCDLDHITPYVPVTDDPTTTGPPGQTRPDNLAALCRRHHRAKTHRGWTYRRRPPDPHDPNDPDGLRPGGPAYTWTSPLGWTLTTRPI